MKLHKLRHIHRIALFSAVQRKNGTFFSKNRNAFQATIQLQFSSSRKLLAGKEVDPASLRKPSLHFSQTADRVFLFRNGSTKQFCSEVILIFIIVQSVPGLLLVVQRQDQRTSFHMGQIVHGIKIGHQRPSQAKEILGNRLRIPAVFPRLLPIKGIVGTMQTHDGRKYPQLYPTGKEGIIPHSPHMSPDVMTPPAVADIAGSGGKIGLKIQAFPGNHRISGETDGITVGSGTGITGKNQTALLSIFSLIILIMIMIQHPKRIQALHAGVLPLLPINPPKIHPVLFHRVMHKTKISFSKFLIQKVEKHRFFFLLIHSHKFRKGGIAILKGPDAVCRMNI